MNRITRGIASTQIMIEEKLASGQVTQEKLDALSESLDTFNNQPVDVKVALTKVFSELLRKHMAA
jgi:2'-5' RNA ligase